MIAAINAKTASNDLDCLHLIWPMIESTSRLCSIQFIISE